MQVCVSELGLERQKASSIWKGRGPVNLSAVGLWQGADSWGGAGSIVGPLQFILVFILLVCSVVYNFVRIKLKKIPFSYLSKSLQHLQGYLLSPPDAGYSPLSSFLLFLSLPWSFFLVVCQFY